MGPEFELPTMTVIPDHQKKAIKELERYRHTIWLRRILATRVFSEKECLYIIENVSDNYRLKNRDAEELL